MKHLFYKKTLSFLALSSALSLYSCQQDDVLEQPVPAQSAVSDAKQTPGSKYIDGQYIVIFKGTGKSAVALVSQLVLEKKINAADIKDQIEGEIKGFSAVLTAKQVNLLRALPFVQTIEQEQLISVDKPVNSFGLTAAGTETTTNDSTITSEIIPDGVQLVGYGDGTGKTAWVIDSGIDVNNPELNVDVARSKSFLTTTTSIQDGSGHGTMVAGIIAAKSNGSEIRGVAANATVVALRVMDDAGNGVVTNVIKAVNHVITNGKAGDVVNISLASGISTTLDNAVKSAAGKGIFFSIAAGNSAVDCSNNSPQRVNATNVYTVSAMDLNSYFWNSSNFGLPVDYAAPGVGILTLKVGGGTTTGSGTSFAAPHVAGLLLLKGNAITNIGTVIGDKDAKPDPIAHL
ncbi:hypothetical protein AAE02nite_30620 [Adhaeribacter aerolatus]|uniref:Peptidase S8/S53 domain-containing protein n=1 Tax=Adhaeribacter aerolatus TaxID=670289 RepID=A0A512B0B1_9BACT|nr:S8 family serine peptidase [Adhaeribacter aerolatus]GEO05398.1 hypothetical protein AAE02nite_30620 [Adhaeribacter aerolatus]